MNVVESNINKCTVAEASALLAILETIEDRQYFVENGKVYRYEDSEYAS